MESLDDQSTEEIEKEIETLSHRIDQNLSVAFDSRKGMQEEVIANMRILAKTDLFFLAYSILGYDRLSPNLHGHLCAWLDANREQRFLEVLLPRAHFKSTIYTISHTIQTLLPDDRGDASFPKSLGPDSRTLIVHESAKMASGYLFSIIQHLMSNTLLMALFPEIVPTPKKQKINSTELVLPRSVIKNEPTVGAMGVGGKSQGLHYDKLILDDIIGDKARESDAQMHRAKEWFNGIRGFFDSYKKSRFTIVGTRWGPDDLYAHAEEIYGDELKIYRRSIEEYDPADLDSKGKPITGSTPKTILPEEVGPEDLIVLKKDMKVFSAQYMNDPAGGTSRFDLNWCRKFEWISNDMIRVESPEKHLKKIIHLSDLRKVLLWDPAVSGNLGWVLVGTDNVRRHFILESAMEKADPVKDVDRMFQLYAKYRFDRLGIEEVLFSELYKHWLEAEFKLRGTRFNIYGIKLRTTHESKEARVMGFSPVLSSGNIYINPTRYTYGQDRSNKLSDLEFQISKFGAIKEYHTLDALANLEEVAMPGYDRSFEARQKLQNDVVNTVRSNLGYSKVKYKSSSGY